MVAVLRLMLAAGNYLRPVLKNVSVDPLDLRRPRGFKARHTSHAEKRASVTMPPVATVCLLVYRLRETPRDIKAKEFHSGAYK